MAVQRIIWTVLPNGVEGGKRRLSILVSPRAEAPSNATLDAFPDFLHWREKSLTFRLRFQPEPAGQGATATISAPGSTPEQVALWTALFGPKLGVEGRAFDGYPGVNVLSFPTLNVLSFISGQYQKFASTPATATQFPAVELLSGDDGLGRVAFGWEGSRPRLEEHPVQRRLAQVLARNRAVPPSEPDTELDFWQLKDLLRPRNPTQEVPLPGGFTTTEFKKLFPAKMPTPHVDFHRALAALGDQPALLRALGLLVDLELGDAEVDAGSIPSFGWVSVIDTEATPGWQLEPLDVTPRTRYASDFTAQPKTSDLDGGFLELGAGFGLVEVDVEGAALKLMNLANTVAASLYTRHRTADTPNRFSLPALRSGGLSLVRSGRAQKLVKRLSRLQQLESDAGAATPAKSDLSAEDLIRGYRADVKDADDPAATWLSLCRRLLSYQVGEGAARMPWPPDGQPPIEEEGWIKLGATSGADRSTEPDLMVTESMFRWTGWSLCARRLGKHIGTADVPEQFPSASDAESETALKLAKDVRVPPASLPRLRFGHRYLVRVRAADLAGNGVPWTHDDTSPTIGPAPYSRFEPVAAPAVVPRTLPGAGESLERIVIRSFNDEPDKDDDATTETVDRHIAPQLVSQLLAEQHGMFDAMSPADSYVLVQSRQGTYDQDDAEEGAATVPHPEAQLPLPYLPDPLGLGAAFLGLPRDAQHPFLGLPGAPLNSEIRFHADGTKTVTDLNPTEKPPITLVHVDFGEKDAWPDLQPFRLNLVEGDLEPQWDATTRELKVHVPKATIATVRLSSVLDDAALSALGIWRWIEEKKPPVSAQTKTRLQQLAQQGRHWMLTPFRELVLVHAVQQPLSVPDIANLSVTRQIGSTSALLHDQVKVHARSTVKLDLDATWSEPVDPVAQPKWELRSGSGHAFEVPIAYPGPFEKPADNDAKIEHTHVFGDTKRRTLSYTVTATSRYREYFEDETLTFTRSRTRTEGLTIPSSARPAAPSVLYAVPTFGWERPRRTSQGAKSVRAGGGVRMYLERPWFSSGEGELLGIVLMDLPRQGADASPRVIPDRLKPFVTQWGGDPLAGTAVTRVALKPGDFPRATSSRGRLTLEELDPAVHTVAVAGHEVEYDEVRQLWYCDVDLDPGDAYFPFVRFALARYQPVSVEAPVRPGSPARNVHLSRVVLAEFIQLAPHRSATISFVSPTVVLASVAGVGITQNLVEVAVETRRPDVPGELGWTAAAGAIVKKLLSANPNIPPRFEVTLPAPHGGRTPFRLVLREFERLPTDMTGEQFERRLVYAETFVL